MKAASSTEGFFQEPPVVENQFWDDEALRASLELFIPPVILAGLTPSLADFGNLVLSPEIQSYVADAEKHPPYVESHTTFGRPQSKLVTSSGWRALQAIGISNGIVAIPFERELGASSRLHQFALYHLWTASAAFVTCPSAMTDGAAILLGANARTNSEFAKAYERLISRDPAVAWTSGQWMTERAGGSDVAGTQTVATLDEDGPGSELGPWRLDGFKWFSSATDGDMAVALAQTTKGLSVFYAPMYINKAQGKLNGVRIQRLKDKMGSKALPTAELELSNMRAHLIGEEGKGIKQIAAILNITRIHTAVSAVGFWGRGLGIAKAFAKVRTVRAGQKLSDNAAHMATLATQVLTYRSWMLLTYFVVALLGREQCPSEVQPQHHVPGLMPDGPDGAKDNSTLLRLLTPIIKAGASKAAIHGLQECMEALGGVGYLENAEPVLNIARLFRDCNVLSIWEGTTNIMADDVVRVIKGKQRGTDTNTESPLAVLVRWTESALAPAAAMGGMVADMAAGHLAGLRMWCAVTDGASAEELRARGREVMSELGGFVRTTLFFVDQMAHPSDPARREFLMRFVEVGDVQAGAGRRSVKERLEADRMLVFGSARVQRERAVL